MFVLYKKTKFFQGNSSKSANRSLLLNSFVIAGSVKNRKISSLKNPVELRYRSLKSGDKNNTFCGFWNFAKESWSDEGCTFQGVKDDGRIVCHCDHLTNFAMLMVS